MATDSTVYLNDVRTFVATVLGIDVSLVVRMQRGVMRKVDHVRIMQTDLAPIGLPDLARTLDGLDPQIAPSQRSRVVLLVETRGSNAYTWARALGLAWMFDGMARQTLVAAGVTPQGYTSPADASVAVRTAVEPRWQFTISAEVVEVGAAENSPVADAVVVDLDFTRGVPSDPQLEGTVTVTP